MTGKFFTPQSIWQDQGIGLIRILVGLFLIYHGKEVFDEKQMTDYGKWLVDLHFPVPVFMAYLGKSLELLAGIFFVIGVFTRIAALILIVTMSGICFGMGHGKIFSDDQHPFLFVLLGFVFLFTGPGKWNFDELIFNRNKS